MEYVDGERIDQYCETRGLGVKERLRLFSPDLRCRRSRSGKTGGTIGGGSRDCNWDGSAGSTFEDQNGAAIPNPNPAIQQNWAALCRGTLTCQYPSQDLTAQGALNFAGQVAANVVASFAEQGIVALAALLVA
jgi:hypothetical protein